MIFKRLKSKFLGLVFMLILGVSFFAVGQVHGAGLGVLNYASYIGGDTHDTAKSIARDASGFIYVLGETDSANFSVVSGGYNTAPRTPGNADLYIAKYSPDLKTLIATTFIGGNQYDTAQKILVLPNGTIAIFGSTASTNYPTTLSAFDKTHNGYSDFIVSIFSNNLTQLLYSTYVGGSVYDTLTDATVSSAGDIFLVGQTSSANFPTVSTGYDKTFNGSDDVVVVKMPGTLDSLSSVTFLGTALGEDGASLALDSTGNVYVSGNTESPSFPVTSGAYDTIFNGQRDIFVTKLSSNLGSLIASTFVGGTDTDENRIIVVNGSSVYLVADTYSPDFPISLGALDSSYSGQTDVVVVKMPISLDAISASTYIGGKNIEYPTSAGFDVLGNIFVTGYTQSSDFPVTSGGYNGQYNGSTDGFVTLLKSDLSTNLSTTYLGGYSADYIWGSTYANGTLYLVGDTMTPKNLGFPISLTALDSVLSNYEGFVASFSGIDTNTPISNPIEVEFEVPQIDQQTIIGVSLDGELPEHIISTFTNTTNGTSSVIQPAIRYVSFGKTYLKYSTASLGEGYYSLAITNLSGLVLAQSASTIKLIAPSIAYSLVSESASLKWGSPALIKVYPGLYAFEKLQNGTYTIQWKTSMGTVIKPNILLGPYPTDGFSLFLTYQFDTRYLRIGTYTVSLIETRTGTILASTPITITN